MDVVDRETRSRMMASIRPVNTAPEVAVRRYLHAAGLRFRLHDKRLPGRPDIVLPAHGIVIFVHGCFWHRHTGCRYTTSPATRVGFWSDKFASNVKRDKAKADMLERLGWTVLVAWECETRDMDRLDGIYWKVRAQSSGSRGSRGRR